MKKLFTGVAILGLAAFASAQTLKVEQEVIDYGTIAKGADGNKVFTVTNTGDKPLIISKVQPSCGCTVPTWSQEPIAPGKSGSIKVHYDTNRPGAFAKTIQVSSNDPVNGNMVLHIKGDVKLDAAEVAPAEAKTARTMTATNVEKAKELRKEKAKAK